MTDPIETERVSQGTVIVPINCVICGTRYFIKVIRSDYEDWKNGKFVQTAFPYLSADIRELFISGICGYCFNFLMVNDEESVNLP